MYRDATAGGRIPPEPLRVLFVDLREEVHVGYIEVGEADVRQSPAAHRANHAGNISEHRAELKGG
jgi:hypothetical protein